MRLIQRIPHKGIGLAIGYGLAESEGDQTIAQAIPNWGLVLCSYSSEFLNTAKLQEARRLAGCDASTHLLLMGFGDDGVKTVFAGFLANTTQTVVGAAMFGGLPVMAPESHRLEVLRAMATRSAAGKAPRLMVYAPDAPEAVAAALGDTLLGVEASPKDEDPARRAARVLAAGFGPHADKMPKPETP